MRLKSFIASDLPSAMEMVRAELGQDAVILSTQSEDGTGQAKVTAALEESPLDAASWSAPSGGLEAIDRISEALDHHGVPGALADRLMSAAAGLDTTDPTMALAGALDAVLDFAEAPAEQADRPVMLIGRPGSGKTATAAKICAWARMAGRNSHIITMDTVKAGAIAQITAFADALQARLDQASDGAALTKLLAKPRHDHFVVIDTTGCNHLAEAERSALADAVEASGAHVVLVLAAGGDARESAECAQAFAELGAAALIPTKLEATRRLGAVLSAAEAGGLALCAAGISPSIGEGLTSMDPVWLARRLLPEAATAAEILPLSAGTGQ